MGSPWVQHGLWPGGTTPRSDSVSTYALLPFLASEAACRAIGSMQEAVRALPYLPPEERARVYATSSSLASVAETGSAAHLGIPRLSSLACPSEAPPATEGRPLSDAPSRRGSSPDGARATVGAPTRSAEPTPIPLASTRGTKAPSAPCPEPPAESTADEPSTPEAIRVTSDDWVRSVEARLSAIERRLSAGLFPVQQRPTVPPATTVPASVPRPAKRANFRYYGERCRSCGCDLTDDPQVRVYGGDIATCNACGLRIVKAGLFEFGRPRKKPRPATGQGGQP